MVVAPGAAEVVTSVDDDEVVNALLLQQMRGCDATGASADDDHFVVRCGHGASPVSPLMM